MYFGKILEYLYTTAEKTYGFYNGRLDTKHFYKTNVQLPYAPVWTLEDMIAQAAKQNITIKYTTLYKDIKIQEQDFVKINSKNPTAVSKASSSEVAKNGRLYNKVKWYPTTITNYNPLPGFNIFGTGLCIKLKDNNDKIINFIKANGADYGWSWCSNFPTTDPDFQNILVYSAGKNKPNKYRDRTSEYPDLEFRPNQDNTTLLGYNPATHKSVWVPVIKSAIVPSGPSSTELVRVDTSAGRYEIVELPKPTIKATTTTQVYVDASVKVVQSGYFNAAKNPNLLKTLVLNSAGIEGAAERLASVLADIGFTPAQGISIQMEGYNKKDITFVDARSETDADIYNSLRYFDDGADQEKLYEIYATNYEAGKGDVNWKNIKELFTGKHAPFNPLTYWDIAVVAAQITRSHLRPIQPKPGKIAAGSLNEIWIVNSRKTTTVDLG